MSRRRQQGLRALVAQEAARLMAEQGIRDFGLAKRKAADRLGLPDRGNLPRNPEIEEALSAHQRLFQGERHGDSIRQKRGIALRTMRMLEDFGPRLVGPVLAGTAAPDGEVNIHLFADTAEDVAITLIREQVPYEDADRRLRLASGAARSFPVFRFFAGEQQVDLTVFARREISEPPLSPVDGRPMRRAGIAEVEGLLEP